MTPELQLLIACGRAPGEIAENVSAVLAGPFDWRRAVELADRMGMIPLLSRAIHRAGISEPPEFVEEVTRRAMEKAMRALGLVTELNRILGPLEDAGLTPLTFKGPTLAYLAYGNHNLRDFSDLDIHVPAHQIAPALEILAGLG